MTDRTVEVFTADIRDPAVRGSCALLYPELSPEEREKADRFLHEDDRLRFIAGRALLRRLAAERLGITEPDIRLTAYGKPYIADAESFHFNISHSGAFVVLAVSDAPVGVDIEQTVPVEWRGISESFGEKEREMLTEAVDPLECFYRIWTIREAFAKEEGIGLSLFENGKPDIDYKRGSIGYCGRRLYFTAVEKDGYSLCVCTGSKSGISFTPSGSFR